MARIIKIATILAVFLLLMLFFSGCHFYFGNHDWSDTENTKLKQNVNAYFGQLAAYYDGRIYYVSQEKGDNGLYSMNPDGTDITFECGLPKITHLIIRPDGYYYVGLKEIEEGQRIFGLYFNDKTSNTAEEIQYWEDQQCVNAAYVAEDGTICIIEKQHINTSIPPEDSTYITDSRIQSSDTGEEPDTRIVSDVLQYNTGNVTDGFVIDISKNFIVGREDHIPYEVEEDNYPYGKNHIGYDGFSFYDINQKEIIMDSNVLNNDNVFKIQYADEERILCSVNNKLIEMNPETLETRCEYKFDNTNEKMKITFLFKSGDIVYAVFESYGNSNKELYYLDLNTLSNGKAATFNTGKRLLNIYNGTILWAEGNGIYCSNLSENGIGDNIFNIDMPENIVDNTISEVASDWLFIHRLSNDKTTNKLLYKINLKTQEYF